MAHPQGARLTLFAQAATMAMDAARLGLDGAASEASLKRAAAASPQLPQVARVWCAPTWAARQTAAAFRVSGVDEPALLGPDFGTWTGRSLEDIAASAPDQLAAWLADVEFAPPEGSSAAGLIRRVATWIQTQCDGGPMLAIAHPMVIRAAALAAVGAPPTSWFRIEVGFLSRTVLTCSRGSWRLRQLNAEL